MKFSSAFWLLSGAVAFAKQPNILFILTDDQDIHLGSLDYMPKLKKYITEQGTTFTQHHCTVAICCPSRANLWTGHAAHNTNVTDVKPPWGGYAKVVSEGWNDNYLPVWLQNAGYNTYYSGKLWNGHTTSNYDSPYAGGFNGSDFLLDPYTYKYYDAKMTRNGAEPVSYAGNYSTDVISGKIQGFLDEALADERPWFVVAAPIAPHSTQVADNATNTTSLQIPEYAERHAHLFNNYTIPRDTRFNAKIQGGVSWMADLPELNSTVIESYDEFGRARLRALQAVDEMVETLVEKLDKAGVLDDTYIVYTTDNGFHISQYRLPPGKECGFDTDIHIPLMIRGPGIEANKELDIVTSHTDLAPTILNLAGAPKALDGKVIPLTKAAAGNKTYEHTSVEYWGTALAEGLYGFNNPRYMYNNTYKGLRLISNDYNLYYSVWCTNEIEFYDVNTDPGQIHNLAADSSTSATYTLEGRSFDQVIARLDALTMVLKSCKGTSCTEPWHSLFPSGVVSTLKDALKPEYDAFFAKQPKVSYSACELGYIVSSEGPQDFNVYGSNKTFLKVNRSDRDFEYGDDWHLYT
ncbi:alkaline-phosphatase-like protein [Phyllosticta paracitricarpa]|uniref:Arylsulfatase n=2 Tax=Phyllosticta TaxID=121621 RepID=A0ABR1MF93_9PEZI